MCVFALRSICLCYLEIKFGENKEMNDCEFLAFILHDASSDISYIFLPSSNILYYTFPFFEIMILGY